MLKLIAVFVKHTMKQRGFFKGYALEVAHGFPLFSVTKNFSGFECVGFILYLR